MSENDLRREIRKLMDDETWAQGHPDGATGGEILAEVQRRTGGFELCSPLDAIDELRAIYG